MAFHTPIFICQKYCTGSLTGISTWRSKPHFYTTKVTHWQPKGYTETESDIYRLPLNRSHIQESQVTNCQKLIILCNLICEEI